MSSQIINYTLNTLSVANKDGSKPAVLKSCTINDNASIPSNVSRLTKSIIFNGTTSISSSLKKTEVDAKKFYGKLIFKTPSKVESRQNLVESNSLPIAAFLNKGTAINKIQLDVNVHNKKNGWSSTSCLFTKQLTPNTWYKLEFAYDFNTLALFINNRLIDVCAFPKGELLIGRGAKIYLGTWVDGKRFPFKGEMAQFELHKGIPIAIESKLDHSRSNNQWHISRKYNTIKPNLNFGKRSQDLVRKSTYAIQYYQFGAIIYSVLGAFEMHGSIYSKYKSLSSRVQFSLGQLQSDEINGNARGSKKSLFRGGGIYWSGVTGAKTVLGQLFLDYENIGEGTHAIGLPIRDASTISGGKMQLFKRGRMYYRNGSSHAKEVHGAILSRYLRLGGHTKKGFPTSDELDVKKGTRVVGKRSDFERCSIYWSSRTGAFEVYGDIARKYDSVGGPIGQLGFPTSGEMDIPSEGGARYNTFQNGTITWFKSWSRIYVCYPFELFLDRIKVRDADDDFIFKDDSDIYARIEVFENGHRVHNKKLPNNGTYSNTTEANLKYTIRKPFVPNHANYKVKLAFEAWDSDSGRPFSGGDDHLGKYIKELSIRNAWGLRDNGGIYNRSSGSRGMKLDWSMRPRIKQGSISDRDYRFWGVRNWGNTHSVPWSVYADAFRDVTEGTNIFDHLSLRSLYYEVIAKDAPKGGNCFGMSLEGIYANKCLSRFGKPLNRFTKNQIQREINTKHLYQLGAAPIWWFVGQFLSGNTHDPKDVFLESERAYRNGDWPVICISQDYWFAQKPHCIMPWKWDRSKTPWEIRCFDPNVTSKETIVKVNPNSNTYDYQGSSRYRGGAWSGGRFHYMPWRVLNSAPRTPNWEIYALLLLGTVIIFGDTAETNTITDLNGNNLDGRKLKSTDSVSRRSKMFVPYPGFDSKNPFNMFLQKGQALNNNYKHSLKGTKSGKLQYGIVNLNQDIVVQSNIAKNELETYHIEKLGKTDNSIAVLNQKNKLYDISYSQKLGHSEDTLKVKIENIPTATRKDLKFSLKPELEGVDIISSGGSSRAKITTEIINNKNKVIKKSTFNTNLENGFRIRPERLLDNNTLIIGNIDRIHGRIFNPIHINPNN